MEKEKKAYDSRTRNKLTKKERMGLTMARLYLLQCGLAWSEALTTVDESRLLQPSHYGLQATTVFWVVRVVSTHTLVLQHHIVICKTCRAPLWDT